MKLKLFTIFALTAIVLAGCAQAPFESDINIVQDDNGDVDISDQESEIDLDEEETAIDQNDQEAEDGVESGTTTIGAQNLVAYENRALGYKIMRPDRWYWAHYIRSQIGDVDKLVDDYFITDRQPLPGLQSEILGKIVIEVSRHQLSDFDSQISGLAKTSATIDGADAQRYEGEKDGKKIIEYHFSKNEKTYRLIYTGQTADSQEEGIFEQVVSSFKF